MLRLGVGCILVKRFLAVIIAFCLLSAIAVQANAYTAYDGSISSTYLDYARSVLPDLKIDEDYVFVRDSQYTYSLFVGDFEVENGVFTASGDVYGYEFVSPSNSYNANSPELRMFSDRNVTITTNNKIVYSNLFGYPKLIEGGVHYEFISAFMLCVIMLVIMLHSLFNFVIRKRNTRRFYE